MNTIKAGLLCGMAAASLVGIGNQANAMSACAAGNTGQLVAMYVTDSDVADYGGFSVVTDNAVSVIANNSGHWDAGRILINGGDAPSLTAWPWYPGYQIESNNFPLQGNGWYTLTLQVYDGNWLQGHAWIDKCETRVYAFNAQYNTTIPDLQPAHRSFKADGGRSRHFYTQLIYKTLDDAQTYGNYEGVAFFTHKSAIDSDMVGLYLCWAGATSNKVQFVTTASNCEGQTYNGKLGYISTYERPGYVPLYRFWNWVSDYLTTTDYQEGVNAGYGFFGILGYTPQ